MANLDKYKIELAKAVKTAIYTHVFKTPEKETMVVDHDPIAGSLTIWIEGRYKITVENIIDEMKGG